MKTLLRAAVTASALVIAGTAMAEPRTTTLAVGNVGCFSCVPIVNKVLSRATGVTQFAVVERFGAATATVSFDDEKVTPEALAQAITNAGFPAAVKGDKNATPTPSDTGSVGMLQRLFSWR